MNTRCTLLGLLSYVVLLASATADQKSDDDLKSFTGKWMIMSLEFGGEKRDVPAGDTARVEFKEGKIFHQEGELFAVKIDASVTPRIIDFTKLKDPAKDQMLEGIYKLDGDTLTICVWTGTGAKSRPADFEAKAGTNFALVVLKKE